MSKLKFVPDIFLEREEMNRFQRFLTTEGFGFDFLANTGDYGIVRNSALDPNFSFLKVTGVGNDSISIAEGFAYDKDRLLIHYPANADAIKIPQINTWYWVKVAHQYTNREPGTISIGGASKGLMTGVGTKFTEVLRGQPNFPAKIKFLNSVRYGQNEYEILEVIDDNNAIVQGNFDYVENDVKFAVVGTFTPGYYIPTGDKYPFQYDDCKVTLIADTAGQLPPLVAGKEFVIARVLSTISGVRVTDYRGNYIHRTRLEKELNTIDSANPVIGIEYINRVQLGGRYFYNVYFDWKLRIQAETQNSADSSVSINVALGGAHKSADYMQDGDFDGWRYYYEDGDYSTIIKSTKVGTSFLINVDCVKQGARGAFICPPVEEIEIQYALKRGNGTVYHKDSKLYEITTENPVITITQDLIAYNGQVLGLRFKYKNAARKTAYSNFNQSVYFRDTAFNDNGDLINANDTATSNSAILGAATVQSFLNVPKYVPLPYTPPAGIDITTQFDDTGLGIAGEFIGWAICNGNNNTDDWRGFTPIGATRIDSNKAIPSDNAPAIVDDATANPVDVKGVVGSSKVTLVEANLPTINLNNKMTDPGHKHDISRGEVGGINPDDDGGAWGTGTNIKTESTRVQTASTGITFAPFGQSQPVNNRQLSRGVIWICRIA